MRSEAKLQYLRMLYKYILHYYYTVVLNDVPYTQRCLHYIILFVVIIITILFDTNYANYLL